jgi:hypothetical protein
VQNLKCSSIENLCRFLRNEADHIKKMYKTKIKEQRIALLDIPHLE